MELSREELEAAKGYMRVEGEDDDLVVMSCLQAARAYMEEAGISLPASGTPRRASYDLVCHAMALSLYDRRETTTSETVHDNPVLRGMLTQMKLTEPDRSKLDTVETEG